MDDSTEKTVDELFGGGEKPKNTRDKLIFTAINLFQENGFHAVGLDYILSEAKLTKSTFYNHFESRDELVLEAVKMRDKWELETFGKAVQEKAGYDPKAMLLAMFDVIDEWFNHPDYKGCIFIAASSEFPSPKHPVRRVANDHYSSCGESIKKMAEGAGIKDINAFSEEWVTLLEGTFTNRQVTGNNDSAKITKRIAESRIKDYLS